MMLLAQLLADLAGIVGLVLFLAILFLLAGLYQ